MSDNETRQQSRIDSVLRSRRWRPVVLLITVLTITTTLFFFPASFLSFNIWNVTRFTAIGVFGGLALVIPPEELRRALQRYVYLIGPVTYVIAGAIAYYGHPYEKPGDQKLYEVCALTLPVLLLAIVIDARLFDRPEAQPVLAFLNLLTLAAGQGAALLAISSEYGSRYIFANVIGSVSAAFAMIIANAIAKIPAKASPDESINALAQFVSWLRSESKPGEQSLITSSNPEESEQAPSSSSQSGKAATHAAKPTRDASNNPDIHTDQD